MLGLHYVQRGRAATELAGSCALRADTADDHVRLRAARTTAAPGLHIDGFEEQPVPSAQPGTPLTFQGAQSYADEVGIPRFHQTHRDHKS